jgi:hypothetical protein
MVEIGEKVQCSETAQRAFRSADIGLKYLVGRGKAGLFAIGRNSREKKLRLVS